jgi:hypothetical protein
MQVVRFCRLKASRQAGVWDRIMDALAAGRAAALGQYSTEAQSQRTDRPQISLCNAA